MRKFASGRSLAAPGGTHDMSRFSLRSASMSIARTKSRPFQGLAGGREIGGHPLRKCRAPQDALIADPARQAVGVEALEEELRRAA